ncbi:uncharacterized protein TNCV_389091 [Trichonephila clavipes]|nr:uncharacterized protein TNCV_389091 [Trichonephila clavipes]
MAYYYGTTHQKFTCRNCGGGNRGRVAIYRPFGEVSLSLNRTVTCMVLKANDRRTSCPCHDEFRGPRSDYVRQYPSRRSIIAQEHCVAFPSERQKRGILEFQSELNNSVGKVNELVTISLPGSVLMSSLQTQPSMVCPEDQHTVNSLEEVARSLTAMWSRCRLSRIDVTFHRLLPVFRVVRCSSVHYFQTRITVELFHCTRASIA